MAVKPPPAPLPEKRAETLHTIRQIRTLVGEALTLELREGQASAEGSDDWGDINDAKWHAYEAAAEVLPNGVAVLERGEEGFLAMLQEFSEATSYQIARKVGLPW